MGLSSPIVDVVRVNNSIWSYHSARFLIDGNPTEGIVALDFEDELEPRIIESNLQDGLPLGMSGGRYRVGLFPMRMLSDSAVALKRYLATKGTTTEGIGSYSATFDLGVQLAGRDAADLKPSTTALVSCRIVAEAQELEEGIDEALTEFRVACLGITRDGVSLYNALAGLGPSAAFPAVDSITIANVQAPGKWTLLSAPKVYGWEVRKGMYLSGATVVPTGDDLVEAEFLVEIWDPKDFLAFKVFRAAYLKKALVGVAGAPVASALGIDHPELQELGCSSVVVREINPVLNDSFGVWMTRVKFLQYRPPVPALGRPDASIPDATPPTPAAQSQLEREVEQASATLQGLGGA